MARGGCRAAAQSCQISGAVLIRTLEKEIRTDQPRGELERRLNGLDREK